MTVVKSYIYKGRVISIYSDGKGIFFSFLPRYTCNIFHKLNSSRISGLTLRFKTAASLSQSKSQFINAIIFDALHVPSNQNLAVFLLKGLSGIYCFRHVATGKMYIGQALNLSIRIIQHINGNKSNVLLQRAINKYGISSFEFLVVEFVADTSLLTTREQLHLDWLFSLSSESRYNICPTAESRLGTTHTAETKALMSKSQQLVDRSGENHPIHGKTHTAETEAAISAALTGKTHTYDSKALMSERQLGNTNRLGKTHTAESKAAIGAALLGNTNCVGRTPPPGGY